MSATTIDESTTSSPIHQGPTAPSSTRWFAVFALFFSGCTLALHAGKVPSALLPLRAEFGLSLVETGAIVSTYAVLIALTGIAVGLLVAVAGHVRFAVFGVCLAGVGSLAGAFASGLPFLLVSRTLEGAGWIIAVVALPALLSPLATARDRPLVMGIWGAFVPVGAGVMLLVAPLLQHWGGWRLSWILAGGVSIGASLVVAWVCRRESALLRNVSDVSLCGPGGRGKTASLGKLGAAVADFRRLAAWAIGLAFFAYSFQFTAVTSFLPTTLVETTNLTLAGASAFTAVVILSNALGNVAAGLLLRRGIGHVGLLVASAACMAAAAALAYYPPSPVVLRMAAALVFSIVGGLIPGTLFATVPRVASSPATFGALTGLMLQCAGVGQWSGPLALPAAVQWLESWSAAGLTTGLAGLVGVLAALALRRI